MAYPPNPYGGANACGLPTGRGRFGELERPGGPYSSGVIWDNNKILSEQNYHHGDHHHHHHQRHMHHFHDLHLISSATETMDLRNTPQVDTRVIPGTGAIDMKLRPDCIGRMVFENGAQQYGFGVQYRLDGSSAPPALPAAPSGAGTYRYGGYQGYSGANAAAAGAGYSYGYNYGYPRGGYMEEELLHHHRRSSL